MKDSKLPFTKKNYQLMLTGIAIIVIGFVLIGMDRQPHGFGIMGLTIGPLVVLLGFLFQFYAIFYKKTS
ncbi:DUF3098 domain-containing protein [Cyclobacterium xiamenense]|jgi:hypothetical protein|uniref:DUF3098 domain-containing protein n=1 Tax=Cyclobacterium xiamenense TaxID=1297121 RepID=UPI0035D00AA1